ncbi:unnamed protein product [Cylicostephanus goldi]|uniref:Uncharacterized protein n=1 Tax=Cylicostephanus goldi TaxID=71465 RepID=A0A3P6RVS9_CYLGO|nr:unnamed protein product [Cylicostephanus goldi]
MDNLLKDFAEDVLKIPDDMKEYFSWPAPAGKSNDILAIRVKISYSFWKYFMTTGRKYLFEHNKSNGTNIVISREKTITLQDEDRLGLYIRKTLRELYASKNKRCPDISMRRSTLKIGNYEPMKPALAAILMDIDLKGWGGLPIISLLSDEDKEKLEVSLQIR